MTDTFEMPPKVTEIQGERLALQRGDESDIICSKPQDVDYP